MSPLEIKIMLHYFVRVDDYDGPENSVLLTRTCVGFVKNDLLRQGTDVAGPKYVISPKGEAYVHMLQDIPVPVVQYVDPRFPSMC